jgi:hypothetical protein
MRPTARVFVDVELSSEELDHRLGALSPREPRFTRGVYARYAGFPAIS